MNTFKVILVGGVGKSTLVKRHATGDFEKKYIATLGVDVTPLRFQTNYGPMVINVWDCAGQEKFGGLRDGYYVQAQGAILAFDLTSRVTLSNMGKWAKDVHRVCQNIPIVLCGTKSDMPSREVSAQDLSLLALSGTPIYEVSSKSNYNYEKPFLELLRKMSGHDDLVLIQEPLDVPMRANL